MKNKQNADKIILQKIIDYCNDIEDLLKKFDNSFDLYITEKSFRYSCDMCILQIGELTARLSEDFKEMHGEISWRAIKAMRNIYVHEYEKTDFSIAWDSITKEIPELKLQIEKIFRRIYYE